MHLNLYFCLKFKFCLYPILLYVRLVLSVVDTCSFFMEKTC